VRVACLATGVMGERHAEQQHLHKMEEVGLEDQRQTCRKSDNASNEKYELTRLRLA
jgi:hypothetical protein